jgi:hypothetical protein
VPSVKGVKFRAAPGVKVLASRVADAMGFEHGLVQAGNNVRAKLASVSTRMDRMFFIFVDAG